jgi:cysteinyl-tRNA synthetase
MSFHLYNTLTKRVDEFSPLHEGIVTMYNCGPTVYKSIHIGNYRSYVFADILRRKLEADGYEVRQIINLTDVGHMGTDFGRGEDKIEKAAREEHLTPYELSNKYTEQFFIDRKRLRLKDPLLYPRATEHIDEVIEMVDLLLKNGHAYNVNGTVYYDIASMPDYGKLSGNSVDELIAGSRVVVDPNKRHPLDFALWINDPKHVLQWQSPWGSGYPGWHMECSVMSAKYLTPAYASGTLDIEKFHTIDIHSGGEDNLFPHHECEIAQSEGATGKKFVNYWLHIKHLIVEGRKMSKSEGNFYTVQDLVDKGISPRAIRYSLMSTNYRQLMNFTFDTLKSAEKNVSTLNGLVGMLDAVITARPNVPSDSGLEDAVAAQRAGFNSALDDNMNMSRALSYAFELRRMALEHARSGSLSAEGAATIKGALYAMNSIFDILDDPAPANGGYDEEIASLVALRDQARKDKVYDEADRLRHALEERGFTVQDTKEGTKIHRKQ